ncbi:fibronectin type III domain-containing protein, partial [archaeon]|nr:fibronectin type III domain-containing protein [archaeon]
MAEHSNNRKKELNKKVLTQYFALFIIALFVNLPVVSALEISGVSAEDVTSDSAVIYWETNETSDSSIYYSTSSETFEDSLVGQESGSTEVTDHTVGISGLDFETEYFYYVESNGVKENNSESYYSFTTIAEETVEEEPVEEASEDTVDVEDEETSSDDSSDSSEGSSSSSGLDLTVEISELVKGNEVDITGDSTEGAEIRVYVNGGYHSKIT